MLHGMREWVGRRVEGVADMSLVPRRAVGDCAGATSVDAAPVVHAWVRGVRLRPMHARARRVMTIRPFGLRVDVQVRGINTSAECGACGTTELTFCAEGHTGPLCGVCAQGCVVLALSALMRARVA